MQLTDPLWTEKWSKIRFTPRLLVISPPQFRTIRRSEEPLPFRRGRGAGLVALARLALRSDGRKLPGRHRGPGLRLRSAGRYAQFLRQRLRSFEYYGLEKPGERCPAW